MTNKLFILPGAFDPVEFFSDLQNDLKNVFPNFKIVIVPMPNIIKMPAWEQAFFAYCKERKIDYENGHFLGFSSGGSLAIYLNKKIEMRSLHLIAPTVSSLLNTTTLQVLVNAMTKKQINSNVITKQIFAYNPEVNHKIVTNKKFLANIQAAKYQDVISSYVISLRKYARKINCDTFMYHGSNDLIEPARHSVRFFSKIDPQLAREISIIPFSGNYVHLDANRKVFLKKLITNLKSVQYF